MAAKLNSTMHNKLVINFNNKKYLSYNKMLPFLLEAIKEGLLFNEYLAIGSGGAETKDDDDRLQDYKTTIKTETVSYNFDPQNGELFVTKRAVISKDHPLPIEIMELGLTPFQNEKNPKIVNRFVVEGGPIIRDKGDEISFEVTIYLGQNEDSMLVFTGGENQLVRRLLGEDSNNQSEWSLARGENTASNLVIVNYEDFSGRIFPAEGEFVLDKENGRVEISISGSVGKGTLNELIVFYNKQAVMRLNVAESFGGGEDSGEASVVVDKDLSISLMVPAVKEVVSITSSSGEEITGYSLSYFGTGFLDVSYDPFLGRSFSKDFSRCVAKDGDRIIFYNKETNEKYVYAYDSQIMTLRESSRIDVSNAVFISIQNNFVILKNYSGGEYSVNPYHYDANNRYTLKTWYVIPDNSYPKARSEYEWANMDVGSTSRVHKTYGRTETAVVNAIDYVVMFYFYAGTYNHPFDFHEKIFSARGAKFTIALGMCNTTKFQDGLFAYDINNKVMHVCTNGLAFYTLNSLEAVEFCEREYDGGLKMGKNYIYGYKASEGKIYYFDIVDKTFSVILLPLCSKIYSSPRLDYIVAKTLSGQYKIYYVDANFTLYEFSSTFPDEVDSSKIEDLEFLKGGLLLFMEDGTNVIVYINEEKLKLSGIPSGTEAVVKYISNSTPGASGSAVRAIINMSVGFSET